MSGAFRSTAYQLTYAVHHIVGLIAHHQPKNDDHQQGHDEETEGNGEERQLTPSRSAAPVLAFRVGRELFAAMKTLTREELDRELDDHLTKSEIKALLARRDLIVALFEDKTREKGEPAQRSSSTFVEPMGCPADDVALSV